MMRAGDVSSSRYAKSGVTVQTLRLSTKADPDALDCTEGVGIMLNNTLGQNAKFASHTDIIALRGMLLVQYARFPFPDPL